MESWRLEQPPNPSTRCCPHLVRFTSHPPSRGEPHFDFAESSTTTQPRPCSCAGTGRHRICAHTRAPRGPRASLAPFRGLLPFTANGLFIIWVGGAVRVSSQAKQSLYSSLATLLWHRGPVTKSVTRANRARAAGPAARAHRVPIAVGGRIRIPQESFPTGAGVGTGLPSRSPATPSLVPGWKAGGWSSRQIHQPGAVRTL